MKNFGTVLALLAVSASYVVSLPHDGNVPRGPYHEALSIHARAAKGENAKGKGQGKGAAAANVTEVANNATAIVNGTEAAANGTANTGKGNNGKGKKKGKGQAAQNSTDAAAAGKANNDAQGLLDQLLAGLESQLGVDLNGDGAAGAAAAAGGQVNVADLLKLLGARDEQPEAGLEKRQGKGKKGKGKAKGKGKGKGKGKANAAAAGKTTLHLYL